MELQLLLESLATNLRTSTTEFAVIIGGAGGGGRGGGRGRSQSVAVGGNRIPGEAIDQRSLLFALDEKDEETRTKMKSDMTFLGLKSIRSEKVNYNYSWKYVIQFSDL